MKLLRYVLITMNHYKISRPYKTIETVTTEPALWTDIQNKQNCYEEQKTRELT